MHWHVAGQVVVGVENFATLRTGIRLLLGGGGVRPGARPRRVLLLRGQGGGGGEPEAGPQPAGELDGVVEGGGVAGGGEELVAGGESEVRGSLCAAGSSGGMLRGAASCSRGHQTGQEAGAPGGAVARPAITSYIHTSAAQQNLARYNQQQTVKCCRSFC